MTSGRDLPTPGWDAITDVFAALYPGIVPMHVGYKPGFAFGSGLHGCSAYRAADHWHYVTYGLTELWEAKSEAEPAVSGWGYEFTMRVPLQDDDTPPSWPFVLLEQLAKTSNQYGTLYDVGHRVDVRQPITGQPDTALTALAMARDPQVPDPIRSANGAFQLLQVVGVTADELALMTSSSTAEVLERLAADNALLVTDPSRAPSGADASQHAGRLPSAFPPAVP